MSNNEQIYKPSEDEHGTPPQGDDSETLVIPKPVTSCDCIEKVTISTMEHVYKQRKDTPGYEIIDGNFERITLFSNKLYMPFIIRSIFTKKNGDPSKERNEHVNIFFTFCPFCGLKYTN